MTATDSDMTAMDRVRYLISDLSPGEKAQALLWLARDLSNVYPGIDVTLGVSGGEPCLRRTRIPVWVVVQARKLGSSESDILCAFPSLQAEDLSNAWAYYDAHKAAIDEQIVENEAA